MIWSVQVKIKKQQREENINKVISEIKESLNELKIHYDITGRSKHFYSIYRKMKYQNKQLEEIFDLTAIRIIVDTVKDCYAGPRCRSHYVETDPGTFQGLHSDAETKPIPVAAYYGDRRQRGTF